MKDPKELIKQAFENTPSVFRTLSEARTRRVGEGYRVASGIEDDLPVTGKVTVDKGPLAWDSKKKPTPLSEVENALLCWGACGPNGVVNFDIDPNNNLSTGLAFAGRTIPGPCNDLATDGTFLYRPSYDRSKPLEIEGDDDYGKILEWFRNDSIRISDSRIDCDWGSPDKWGAAGKGALTGVWQHNLGRPGATFFMPVTDSTRVMINVMMSGFQYMKWLFVDDDTGEPMGIADYAKPGYLEVPVPWSMYEEIVISLEHAVVGMMVQNIRMTAESMGLGHWCFGGIAEDIILGGYPTLAKGLGFEFETIKSRNFFKGISGIWESYGWPSPWFKNTDEIVDKNAQLRTGSDGGFFTVDCTEGCVDKFPYKEGVLEAIRNHPKIKIDDWVIDATKKCLKYIVDKHGRFPVFYSPFHCQFVAQVHHVDLDFYKQYYHSGYMLDRIENHYRDWH